MEQRFFERRDSEPPRHSWTSDADLDFEAERRSTHTTRISTGRSAVARTLGFVGVLGVLALALAAFAPRMTSMASKLALAANRVELPWDPGLQPGPEPLALDREPNIASLTEAPAPLATRVEEVPAVRAEAPPVGTPEAESSPSETTPYAGLSTLPPEQPMSRSDASISREQYVSQAPFESREPALTPDEIEMREQRYEAWLRSEGLERVR